MTTTCFRLNFAGIKFPISMILTLTLMAGTSQAATIESKSLVTESKVSTQSGTTTKISFKVKRPKTPKGATLEKGLQIKGCWLKDNFKSLAVKDAANRKVKFKLSKDGSALEFKKIKTLKFPLKATLNFKTEVPLVARTSTVGALGQTQCLSIKKKNGKIKKDCSEVDPVLVFGAFSGVACSGPGDLEGRASQGQIVFADGDQFSIRPRTQPLNFAMSGATFNSDITDASIILNDVVYVAPDVQLVGGILSLNATLNDGKNTVSILALDSEGLQASNAYEFWAGSNTLTVLMRDSGGQAVDSGQLTLKLADDPDFFRAVNFSGGQAVFNDVPGTTVALYALSNDGQSGFGAGAGGDITLTVTMLPLLTESAVANNDISDGTNGWALGGGANVTVIPHTEDEPAALPDVAPDGQPDQDLVLHTSGEGPRFMTRTFRTDPRTRLVRIRYRFQTSEYPGGYFGTKYNDFYNVSLRSSQGANIHDDGSSMNALGRAAFSPSGYTVWKSTVIPVNRSQGGSGSGSSGEVVQASVVVANVADGAYDSRVVVDKIEESSFAITDAQLYDIDNSKLEYLSADTHAYFNGFTRINGTVKFEGDKEDKITEVYLQLMIAGQEVGRAELSTVAATKILNKKFGKSGKIEIKTPILLFKIFPRVLSGLTSTDDRDFSLVIQAKTDKGGSAHHSLPGSVKQLVRYQGTNRYDGRDETEGGDDWVLPSIQSIVNQINTATWGDFSNMNGGRFPPHSLHRMGRSVDGWVDGYNSLDATAANALIDLLNSGLGSRVHFIYARFNRNPGNSFYQAIAGKTLNNGRRVDRVILPDAEHDTHFHLEF